MALSDVRYVVFDEADTMFSDRAGFLEESEAVVNALAASAQHARLERPVQYVLAAATPDRKVMKTLQRVFPVRCLGSGLIASTVIGNLALTHAFPVAGRRVSV